jgi:hypothetical protein
MLPLALRIRYFLKFYSKRHLVVATIGVAIISLLVWGGTSGKVLPSVAGKASVVLLFEADDGQILACESPQSPQARSHFIGQAHISYINNELSANDLFSILEIFPGTSQGVGTRKEIDIYISLVDGTEMPLQRYVSGNSPRQDTIRRKILESMFLIWPEMEAWGWRWNSNGHTLYVQKVAAVLLVNWISQIIAVVVSAFLLVYTLVKWNTFWDRIDRRKCPFCDYPVDEQKSCSECGASYVELIPDKCRMRD